MALTRNPPKSGCLFHSGQGIENAAHTYRETIEEVNLVRSMSRKGNPLNNATMESYFHSLKAEHIHQQLFDNDIEAVVQIIEYMEFYTHERLHSSLDYQSPEAYERKCA